MSTQVFNREALANWYAHRHLDTDDAIREVHYLPTGAPDREIRFLEVNNLISEATPIEPVDFAVDVSGDDAHRLYVLDVTPNQWDAIRQARLNLPAGWSLDRSIIYQR